MLLNPIKNDPRYSITKEWIGQATPHFVLRYCDEYIASSKYYQSMLIRAVGLNAEHRGALIIEAV